MAKWALSNNNQKIGYVTPTLKLSKLFHKELCQSLHPFIINENKTDLIIEFKTGSYVQFFSAEAGDSIRGFQHHLTILDEVAFMKDDILNLIIRPTWSVIGKKVILCSTPNGNSGFFYENCQAALSGDLNSKIKRISIYDNPFISKEEIEMIKKQVPERVWKQEYLGEFVDGSGTVFTNYKNCVGEPLLKTGRIYAGIDWGKQNDYTVVTFINEAKEIVDLYRINTIDYTQQVKLVTTKLNKWKPYLTVSEENNIGTVVNEMLKKEYNGKIRTVTLDNKLKKDMIENLVVAFEQEDITIPNNEILLGELQAFTCVYNPSTQNIKYNAPSGLHDDMIISLAYAYDAVKHKKANPVIRIY